tara:strand:- start:118 stop:291 length:174 start_codon:yes stop_codon:yes gene_type:complete
MNIEYKTYDELISLVAEFRLQHKDLSDEDQDRLLLKTFKIDRATLREMDGVSDLLVI